MNPYEFLKKKPHTFKNLTGVSPDEFEQLCQKLGPFWMKEEQERLSRSNRQRAIGGGHPYTLALEEQLLMTLLWRHLRLNTVVLGSLFGVNKATVSRNTRRVWQVLTQLGEPGLNWPEPPGRGHGKKLEQACCDYPDLRMLVETIEQAGSSFPVSNPHPQPLSLLCPQGAFGSERGVVMAPQTSR